MELDIGVYKKLLTIMDLLKERRSLLGDNSISVEYESFHKLGLSTEDTDRLLYKLCHEFGVITQAEWGLGGNVRVVNPEERKFEWVSNDFDIKPNEFEAFYAKVKKILEVGNAKNEGTIKFSYTSPSSLQAGNKIIPLRSGLRNDILAFLFRKSNINKLHYFSEIYEEIADSSKHTREEFITSAYSACDGLQKHIERSTGINDLLIFNTKTVRLNKKYTA